MSSPALTCVSPIREDAETGAGNQQRNDNHIVYGLFSLKFHHASGNNILVGAFSCILAWHYLRRTNIMEVIREEHINEPVKELGKWCGPAVQEKPLKNRTSRNKPGISLFLEAPSAIKEMTE